MLPNNDLHNVMELIIKLEEQESEYTQIKMQHYSCESMKQRLEIIMVNKYIKGQAI